MCLKPSLVRQKLRCLPKDLEETYAHILTSIPEDYREDACTALRWLTFSERPLKLDELIEALLVVPSRDPPYNPEDPFSDPHGILQILPGLVAISSGQGSTREEIRLAHFSVKEYLMSNKVRIGPTADFGTSLTTANQFITESCLVYILQYDQAQERTNSAEDVQSFPLIEYACRYWYVHKRVFSSEEQTPTNRQASADALLMQLLVSDTKTLDWLQVHRPDMVWAAPFEQVGDHASGSSLYYAACIGFREAVRRLLDKGTNVTTWGGIYGTPLRGAARFGHKMTCLLLLDRGAWLENEDDFPGGTPLWCAADSEYEPTVRILLQNGANIEAGNDTSYGTPIYAAATNRHVDVVRLLLEKGAGINARTTYGKTALRGAAMNGDLTMINLLLDHKADIETQDQDGQTPLIRAAVSGKSDAINLLQKRSANIEAKDYKNRTAPSWAAFHGQIAALSVLLDGGTEFDETVKDIDGQTPLHRAAVAGKHHAIRMLLQHGANADAEDSAWLTPLDWASRNGHFEVVSALTQARIDPTEVFCPTRVD